MKELVSTAAVSIRHARTKICTTVLDWLPHSHFPAHMQHTRFVMCVDFLIYLLSWWGSNSCMLMSFKFFAFQFASGPISQIWRFFFTKHFVYLSMLYLRLTNLVKSSSPLATPRATLEPCLSSFVQQHIGIKRADLNWMNVFVWM